MSDNINLFQTGAGLNTESDSKSKSKRMKSVDYALFLLGRQDYTTMTIKQSLKKKGYSVSEVDEALSFVVENGFVDDYRYAQNYINAKKSTYGKSRMKQFLYKKGISKDLFEKAYEEFEDEFGENVEEEAERAAYEFAKKKFAAAPAESHSDPKLWNKVLAALARRGFSYDVSKRALEAARESLK